MNIILQRILNPSFWRVKYFDFLYMFTQLWWRRKPTQFFRVKHGKLFLEPHEGFRAFLRANDMWEPAVREKLYHVLRNGDHVLDLGSNYGEFAIQMADLVGEKGKIVGVEMDPHYQLLLALVKEYNPPLTNRMTFLNAALSDENDLDWISKKGNILPTFYFSDIEGAERILVDQLFSNPKWLKHSPRLLLELHPEIYGKKVESDIIEKFKKAGYTVESVDYKHYYFWR